MVELINKSEKYSDGDVKITSVFKTILDYSKDIETILKKKFTELEITIKHMGQSEIMTHGRDPSYFNSKVYIRGRENYPISISSFSISCFPNCCGIGVLTSNYESYASPLVTENGFKSGIFTLKLAKMIAYYVGYKSLILTIVDDDREYSVNIKKLLEEEKFKIINTSLRKGMSGGNLLLYSTNSEQVLFEAKKELFNYLENI